MPCYLINVKLNTDKHLVLSNHLNLVTPKPVLAIP